MKSRFTYAFTLLLLLAAWNCRTSAPSVTRQNFANYYKTEEKIVRPRYTLYNVSDSMARIYFSVNSNELLYTKNANGNDYVARIAVSYVLHPAEYMKVMTDSGHVVMSDVAKPGEQKLLAAALDMDVISTGRYVVEMSFRDLNKMTVSYAMLYLDHGRPNAMNNFLLTMPESETPLFRNYVDSAETFNLHYYKSNIRRFYVRHYSTPPNPAPPPYSLERSASIHVPDSSFWMQIDPHTPLRLAKTGYYCFAIDSQATGGIVVSRFHPGFPEITEVRQLLYPLRYLTNKNEYYEMDTAANVKRAVDKFWLNCSGSQERAREVIRQFYNRVAAANTLFSTEKEGWKTDRGMIYLIFGLPNNVYRNSETETWSYSPDVGGGGVYFVFSRNIYGFTDNEFVLNRNTDFKVNWIQAVDSWRQGHVYSLH